MNLISISIYCNYLLQIIFVLFSHRPSVGLNCVFSPAFNRSDLPAVGDWSASSITFSFTNGEPRALLTPPWWVTEVSLVSPTNSERIVAPTLPRLTVGSHNVQKEWSDVLFPLFMDYSSFGPGECLCEETRRVLLHWQYLPSKMRVEMSQPSHHPHIGVLQTLSGKFFDSLRH